MPRSNPDPAADFSAKIKRTLIELHGYAYFHNPSEIGDVDERFFGRTKIAGRLKALLTSHETKAGSYLVTGYRGVGKSSLVAKVLSEISFGRNRSGRNSRYFRIFSPLLVLALLFPTVTPWHILAFLFIAALFFLYLVRADPTRDDLRLGESQPTSLQGKWWLRFPKLRAIGHTVVKWWRHFPKSRAIGHTFIMEAGRSPELRFRALLQDLYLISLIEILALTSIWAFDVHAFRSRLGFYLFFYVLLMAITATVVEYRRAWRRARARVTPLKVIGERCLSVFRNYVNYSHRVYVKINLGQDDLREIEILRLIAKSILTKYRAFTRMSTAYWIWRLLALGILVFAVGVVYYYDPLYRLNLGLKYESQIYRYFPTQGSFMLENGTQDLDAIIQETLGPGSSWQKFDLAQFWDSYDNHLSAEYEDTPLFVDFPDGFLGGMRRLAIFTCTYADLFLHLLYTRVRDNLPLLPILLRSDFNRVSGHVDYPADTHFQILPAQLDYLFLLYLFLFWRLLKALPRLNSLGFVTHGVILRQLTTLNDAIDAQVTKEQSATLGMSRSILTLGLSGRNSKTYPIASVREIERRLLDILDDIDRIPRLTVRPNFIFIFDELDKIEPHKNVAISEKEEEQATTGGGADQAFSSYEAARERQHRILGLLSNLKHFFTTAKAKFIFIAGREMFDASLADVSDRHFFMGSIFNDVIYVPSFLRDPSDGKLADVTSMTEFYVCRFLLPPSLYQDKDVSLQTFNDYLSKKFFKEEGTKLERELSRKRREKIVMDLAAFIIYLTYRSNGAPKKITRFLEDHIRRVEDREELLSRDTLTVGRCSTSLYLELNFYDQYTFGLVAYLANPLFLLLNKTIKDFGDKLLVSTSFLLDHIYKFHSFGFSWRNLELIPEIVDINRAPELRELIGNIIHFLGSAHVDEVSTGLYDFRFRRQINEEIAFLSRISEREAAAFNFTLDESLSLKRHYNRKLTELVTTYGPYDKAQASSYVHSIGFVRMILGDLHFYDEEYDQAIIQYMEAVQSIQSLDPKENVRRLVVLVRNILKLGFAFEKKKTFDSALAAYGRLAAQILAFRQSRSQPVTHGESEKGGPVPPAAAPEAAAALELDPFASIRLLYQPLLAKLYVIEKVSPGGITRSDISTVERELACLVEPLDPEEKSLITAEFTAKIGDALYFKNGPLPLALLGKEDAPAEEQVYCLQPGALCSRNAHLETLSEAGYHTPCRACRCYMESLNGLGRSALRLDLDDGELLIFKLLAAFDSPILGRRAAVLKELGRCLAAMGDTFLSCSAAKQEQMGEPFLEMLLTLLPAVRKRKRAEIVKDLLRQEKRTLLKNEEAILCFLASALFYRQAGDHKSHSFQLTKILFVIRDHLAITQGRLSSSLVEKIREELVWRAIRGIYRTYESTHRLEIETFQEIFEDLAGPRHRSENVRLNNVSLSFEVREIVILFKEIELRAKSGTPFQKVPDRVEEVYLFTSPYALINSIYNRVHELRFRGNANEAVFREFGFDEAERKIEPEQFRQKLSGSLALPWRFGIPEGEPAAESVLEFLITDSIFCFHEIVRSLRIYGVSYMASHSMRAAAHEKLAVWCRRYYDYLAYLGDEKEKRERIEKKLSDLIGKADLISVAPRYHDELAMVHYRSALEAHSEGRAYRELIEKMYYLNDDFSDKLTHFCAGLERYRINSGRIREKIEGELIERLRGTRVYDPDRYYAPTRFNPEKNNGSKPAGTPGASEGAPSIAPASFASEPSRPDASLRSE